MPITKCSNETCPKAGNCLRKLKVNEDYQQYAPYSFEMVDNQAVCRDFWPVYHSNQKVSEGVAIDLSALDNHVLSDLQHEDDEASAWQWADLAALALILVSSAAVVFLMALAYMYVYGIEL